MQDAKSKENEIEEYLFNTLDIQLTEKNKAKKGLTIVKYKNIKEWGVDKILNLDELFSSNSYELKPIKQFAQLVRGVTYKKSSEIRNSNDFENSNKVLRANNINLNNTLNLEDIKHISKKENFSDEKVLKKDDIFICLASGSKKHIGKVVLIEEDTDYFFGGFMGAIRITNKEILAEYLNAILNTSLFNSYLSSKIFGANINNLNSTLLYNFKIPVPSIEAQSKITSVVKELKEDSITFLNLSEGLKSKAIVEFENVIFNSNL